MDTPDVTVTVEKLTKIIALCDELCSLDNPLINEASLNLRKARWSLGYRPKTVKTVKKS